MSQLVGSSLTRLGFLSKGSHGGDAEDEAEGGISCCRLVSVGEGLWDLSKREFKKLQHVWKKLA